MEKPPTRVSRWQAEDGFPTNAYFAAVEAAIGERGIAIETTWRDEDWDYTIELAPKAYAEGPLARRARHGLYIGWRADEMDTPTHPEDYSGLGWHWVPWGRPESGSGVYQLAPVGHPTARLAYLADPDEVAEAVVRLVTEGEASNV